MGQRRRHTRERSRAASPRCRCRFDPSSVASCGGIRLLVSYHRLLVVVSSGLCDNSSAVGFSRLRASRTVGAIRAGSTKHRSGSWGARGVRYGSPRRADGRPYPWSRTGRQNGSQSLRQCSCSLTSCDCVAAPSPRGHQCLRQGRADRAMRCGAGHRAIGQLAAGYSRRGGRVFPDPRKPRMAGVAFVRASSRSG